MVEGLNVALAFAAGRRPFASACVLLERALPALRALARHRRRPIDWGSAGVLAAMGLLLLTNNLAWIAQRLTDVLPHRLASELRPARRPPERDPERRTIQGWHPGARPSPVRRRVRGQRLAQA